VSRDTSLFANLIAEGCEKFNGKTVVSFLDKSGCVAERRSFCALYSNGNALAAFLVEKGMLKGDRFAVVLQNQPENVEALIAASIAGCVLVSVDPRSKADRLAYILNQSNCRGVICADYNATDVAAVVAGSPVKWSLLVMPDHAGVVGDGLPDVDSYFNIVSLTRELLELRCESGLDPLQILYAACPSDNPDGITSSNSELCVAGKTWPEILGLGESDVLYTGLSLSHPNAQFLTLAVSLATGIPSVYSCAFSRYGFWSHIRRHGCTVINLLGAMYLALYNEPPKRSDPQTPARLGTGSGIPAAILKDFSRRFDLELVEFHGAGQVVLFPNRVKK